jgi:ABC-type nitrate/sulfonate/bicarbonate transport system ATPase subunit
MNGTYRTDTLVSIENVSLELNGKSILRNMNATIKDLHRPDERCVTGQVVAILGPSGIGKTRLLRILAGLDQPTSGAVYITPERVKVNPGSVGMVFQDSPLFRHRTVLDNLKLSAKRHGLNEEDARAKSVAMLRRFGLEDKARSYPAQLSGGMRQRVAISQQLLSSEHYLLMDEPFAALDPINTRLVCGLITEVANLHQQNTIILTSHNIQAALSVADTLLLIGRDKEHSGAVFVREFDLVERNLCWNPTVETEPAFVETEREIRELFRSLP